MNSPVVLSAIEQDSQLLDLAGAAMYKIREPKGSQRLSFYEISAGKQRRNRELAVKVIREVLQQYPDPMQESSADLVKDYMAETMYRTLAPGKAESFPLDQRTPFAKSYYRHKAEGFFFDFLSPFAQKARADLPPSRSKPLPHSPTRQLPHAETSTQLERHLGTTLSKVESGHSPKEVPAKLGHVNQQRPASDEGQRANAKPPATPTPTSSRPPLQQVPPTQAGSAMIGFLLLLILIVLVVLLIRTF